MSQPQESVKWESCFVPWESPGSGGEPPPNCACKSQAGAPGPPRCNLYPGYSLVKQKNCVTNICVNNRKFGIFDT